MSQDALPVIKVFMCLQAPGDEAIEGGAQAIMSVGTTAAIFNDTYILFDGSLAIPTHVVSYHLMVDEATMQDKELLRWVNEQCQATFGFSETSFANYFVSLAQSSDSAANLCTKLRDQADVPHEVAQDFADDLFHRVCRTVLSPGQRLSAEDVPISSLRHALRLLSLPAPPQGATQISAQLSQDALKCIEQQMSELETHADDLKEMLAEQESVISELDKELFERSGMFRADLVSYLKEYMLTLQVAEERQQQMIRCINDAYNLREFMEQQRGTMTKVALLRQWKNLEPLRADLNRRLASLSGLQGQSLAWLAPTSEDSEVQELKRQVQQKDRVVQILKQRLRTSAGSTLTQEEEDLINL